MLAAVTQLRIWLVWGSRGDPARLAKRVLQVELGQSLGSRIVRGSSSEYSLCALAGWVNMLGLWYLFSVAVGNTRLIPQTSPGPT